MRKRLILGIATAGAALLFTSSIHASGLQAWAWVILAVAIGQVLGNSDKFDDVIVLFLITVVAGLISLGHGVGFNSVETLTMVIIGGIIASIIAIVIFGLLAEAGYLDWILYGSPRLQQVFDFVFTVACYAGLGYLAALAIDANAGNTLVLMALGLLMSTGAYTRWQWLTLLPVIPLLGMVGGIALGEHIGGSWALSVLLGLSGFCLPIVVALLSYAYMADRNDRRAMDYDDVYYIAT